MGVIALEVIVLAVAVVLFLVVGIWFLSLVIVVAAENGVRSWYEFLVAVAMLVSAVGGVYLAFKFAVLLREVACGVFGK